MIELMYGDDGVMRVAPQPEEGEFGILSKSAVVLHALNSSKWVSVLLTHWNMLPNLFQPRTMQLNLPTQ